MTDVKLDAGSPAVSPKERCSEFLPGGVIAGWTCSKRGVVKRGEKWFCRIHDPAYIAAKQKERDRKWQIKRDVDAARAEKNDHIESETSRLFPLLVEFVEELLVELGYPPDHSTVLTDAKALLAAMEGGK